MNKEILCPICKAKCTVIGDNTVLTKVMCVQAHISIIPKIPTKVLEVPKKVIKEAPKEEPKEVPKEAPKEAQNFNIDDIDDILEDTKE